MKNFPRLTALLLCLCLIVGMTGCIAKPAPSITPTEATTESTQPTQPPEPSASDVYAAAFNATVAASSFLMEVNSSQTITLADQAFTQSSTQSLYYTDYGTDAQKYRSAETITYGEDSVFTYEEIYIDGMLYANLNRTERFRGEMSAEDATQRYLDPTMLDASLYGQITASGDGTILFENPTAAESWAMPENAEFLQASGAATVGADGKLKTIAYTISYRYGPTEVSLEIDVSLMFGPTTVSAPTEADKYVPLQDVHALALYMNALGTFAQSSSMTTSSLESVMSQAAAVVRNQSTTMNLVTSDEDTVAKVDTEIYMMDYTTEEEQQFEQEELFMDGKYTTATDGGEPTEIAGVTAEDIITYCDSLRASHIVPSEFWTDAVITNLGSTLLIELELNEAYGDFFESSVCNLLWGDGNFLRDLASDYEFKETSGYFAVDTYTGLPTSGGYYFEETHTVEGTEYTLTFQSDQSIDGASMDAYFNITDEMPEAPEPENKPTPLFYHVTGEDGQEMWLLGTIHVGDVRTAYLPKKIYDAFAASDALALEVNSKLFDEMLEQDEDLQNQISDLYYFSDGKTIESVLDEELYQAAVQIMKASGSYHVNAPYMKPFLWSQLIDDFNLRYGRTLHSQYGVEEQLHKWAEELSKEIREVESSLFQLQMFANYSDELQVLLLEEAMASSVQEYRDSTLELFEKWCQGDEAALRQLINEEIDLSELTEEELAEYNAIKSLIDEYDNAINHDRNEDMLQVAISYLESGDVVFYAVGLAHLLDDTSGLVDALRAAGYTVEPVSYT